MNKKIVLLRRKRLGNTSVNAVKEFSKNNIEVVRNDKPIPQDSDLLIRWGCTSKVSSKNTLNKSNAIHAVNDKINSRLKMEENNISTPKVFKSSAEAKYPCIMRPTKHSQGKNLWLCNSHADVLRFSNKKIIKKLGYYLSEYIEKEREFGVFIFNDRITSVIEKVGKNSESNKSIAWNVSQGTHSFENINWTDWPIDVCVESLKAIKLFDLDFGRVDVIYKDGKAYILEINSAHSLTSPYRQEVFAKCVDYLLENGKVQKEIEFEKVKTYKSIIHPALRPNNNGLNL